MIPSGPLSPNMSQGDEGVAETPIVSKGLGQHNTESGVVFGTYEENHSLLMM